MKAVVNVKQTLLGFGIVRRENTVLKIQHERDNEGGTCAFDLSVSHCDRVAYPSVLLKPVTYIATSILSCSTSSNERLLGHFFFTIDV